MPPKNEAALKTLIKQYLKELDPNCFSHTVVETGFGSRFVDMMVCLGGDWLIIETKMPGGKVTPRQQATLDTIKAAGGAAFVAHSLRQVLAHIPLRYVDAESLYRMQYEHRDNPHT
jgi:hypothetical protein